jgi:hypothetical protein
MSIEVDLTSQECSVSAVEIETILGQLDLHNFADFEGFSYRTIGTLDLTWVESQAGEFTLGGEPIRRARLSFEGVRLIGLTPRNMMISQSEDRSLDSFIIDRYSIDDVIMRFEFMNESTLTIEARTIKLFIDRT